MSQRYTPPRFATQCGRLGMVPGFCVDLATRKANGEFWDLTKEPDCEELERIQAREQPRLVIGSPPCATLCPWLRVRQTEKEVEERQRREGEPHVRTAVDAYWRQLATGAHFLREHLAGSASWKMPEVVALAADPRVYVVQGPMCRWSMTLEDKNGQEGYVRKETKWMTSSAEIALTMEGTCSNRTGGPWRRRVQLIG